MLAKKVIITSIFFMLLIVLGLVFRPVPIPSSDNTIKALGTIEEVSMTGTDDVIIKLRGDDRLYFINQGLTNGVTLENLRGELSGKSVEIYYVKYWTPIDPLKQLNHIAKVDVMQPTMFPDGK